MWNLIFLLYLSKQFGSLWHLQGEALKLGLLLLLGGLVLLSYLIPLPIKKIVEGLEVPLTPPSPSPTVPYLPT